jgi:hypothetical protein
MLVCECGATRASAGLRTMACVSCGRAMHAPLPPAEPRPRTGVLALAALISQLVAMGVLALAIIWVLNHRQTSTPVIAFGGVALAGVITGSRVYRGSLVSVLLTAIIDAGFAGILFSRDSVLASFTYGQQFVDPDGLSLSLGGLAAVAAMLCAIAIPQARRFTAWQHDQLERAVRAQL